MDGAAHTKEHEMKLESMVSTHVGNRSHNEDSHLCADALGLYLVADGMGGHSSGEVASSLAIETVAHTLSERIASHDHHPIHEAADLAIQKAHRAIVAMQNSSYGKYNGIGTTLAMVWLVEGRVVMAHMGDSRIYRLRDARLEQMTTDHSLVEMLRAQQIDLSEEVANQYKNIITRALGMSHEDAVPDVRVEQALPGDMYLLSSDGLHGVLEHGFLEMMLLEHGLEAAALLTQAAYDAGGSDNITTIVASVV
jgi:protein phosphatase